MPRLVVFLVVVMVRGFVVPRATTTTTTTTKGLLRLHLCRRLEYPVFDPLDDKLSFPIPFDDGTTTSYRFTRPMHIRLIEAVLASDDKCFFHKVAGDVGCVARVVSVVEEAGEERVWVVGTTCVGRGRIDTTVATVPFARANIAPIFDVDDPRADECQREAFRVFRSVARLSSKLEARGPFAEAAEEQLARLDADLVRLEEDAIDRTPVDRRERAGFFLLARANLDREMAARALATDDAALRFELVLSFLTPLESEFAAKVALDALQGETPPALQLRKGNRVSFWWTQEDGWFEGTVVGVREPREGWYRLRWDVDNSESHVQMDFENRGRWRLIDTPSSVVPPDDR